MALYGAFWTERLDVLERLLCTEDAGKSSTPKGDDK
jgi:hypothetical protein